MELSRRARPSIPPRFPSAPSVVERSETTGTHMNGKFRPGGTMANRPAAPAGAMILFGYRSGG